MGTEPSAAFRILAITQGQWGERIANHVQKDAPQDWQTEIWAAPRVLPPIIDDPQDFLPPTLAPCDLVLALGDVPGLAQLITDVVRMTGARAVIAPIDRNASLPTGLATQLRNWLEGMGVAVAFPKPFCSLSESSYNRTPIAEGYDDPLIRRFASAFGKPEFRVAVQDGVIAEVDVLRDSACGCARHVAENLIGTQVDEAVEAAGMLHHHFPCLAGMEKDADYRDTLMHVSGNLLQDALKDEIRDHLSIQYLRPSGRVETDDH